MEAIGIKWAHYVDGIMLTRLASSAEQSVNFAGTSVKERMGSKPTENSRPRYHYKVLGSRLVGKTCIVAEGWLIKCQPIQPLRT